MAQFEQPVQAEQPEGEADGDPEQRGAHGCGSGSSPITSRLRLAAMESVAAASMTTISGLAQPVGYCSQPSPNQAQAAATAPNSSKIGRATCRERVWPYVWNPGGAVPIKKKN